MTQIAERHNRWIDEPEYQKAYKTMALKFEVASAVIAARKHAGLTQEELAQRMDAKQAL